MNSGFPNLFPAFHAFILLSGIDQYRLSGGGNDLAPLTLLTEAYAHPSLTFQLHLYNT